MLLKLITNIKIYLQEMGLWAGEGDSSDVV
jgi:hypothetical protein